MRASLEGHPLMFHRALINNPFQPDESMTAQAGRARNAVWVCSVLGWAETPRATRANGKSQFYPNPAVTCINKSKVESNLRHPPKYMYRLSGTAGTSPPINSVGASQTMDILDI